MNVSVIVPTRNYGRFLADAVKSILGQSLPAMEVIVVDDASDDNTVEVARGFGDKIRYVRLDVRGGAAAARNTGLKLAVGEVVCFLDSDDIWLPGALEILVGGLEAHPEAAGASARIVNVPDSAMDEALACPASLVERAFQCWGAGGLLLRRNSFEKVGFFDEGTSIAELVAWVSLARDQGLEFATFQELVVLRRVHGANSVLTMPTLAPGYMHLIRQHMERQRAAASREPQS
ncbi:glycosyltransferase family 2 protein [Verrucomicrobium spinosum]|nr:glycosyltransferase family A protein [Verrucomicrobium spinosum]